MSDLERAKAALRHAVHDGLARAAGEYDSFLYSLGKMEKPLREAGITFQLPTEGVPEELVVQTRVGPIQMKRILVLHDEVASYAVVFSDPTLPTDAAQEPPLWWVCLNWTTQWFDAIGTEFDRDFATDVTKSHLVFDVVRNAEAQKLLRNTRVLKVADFI